MRNRGGPATVIPPFLKERELLNKIRENKRKPLSRWMGRLVKGRESQETSLDTEVTGLRGKVEVIFLSSRFFQEGLGDFFYNTNRHEL